MQPFLPGCLGALALLASATAAEKSIPVTVNAGEFDRRGTVVHFKVPDGVKPDALLIRRNASRVPFQMGKNRMAVLVLDELKKGAVRRTSWFRRKRSRLADSKECLPVCWPSVARLK
jgi:hypothetical protein